MVGGKGGRPEEQREEAKPVWLEKKKKSRGETEGEAGERVSGVWSTRDKCRGHMTECTTTHAAIY